MKEFLIKRADTITGVALGAVITVILQLGTAIYNAPTKADFEAQSAKLDAQIQRIEERTFEMARAQGAFEERTKRRSK